MAGIDLADRSRPSRIGRQRFCQRDHLIPNTGRKAVCGVLRPPNSGTRPRRSRWSDVRFLCHIRAPEYRIAAGSERLWSLAKRRRRGNLSPTGGSMPDAIAIAATHEIEVRDVEYRRDSSGPLLARLYQPKGSGPFPALIDVHGGAWAAGDRLN